MEIYLIRHTTPRVVPDVCYGQTDLALTDSFEAECQTLRGKLPEQFDAIYSSPLQRCRLLAECLKGAAVQYDKRLLELNFGGWEMKRWNDIDQNALNIWMEDFVKEKAPGGESFHELWLRTTAFLQDIQKNSFKTIALVTHAGVIRTMISHILGMPLKNAFQLQLDYGAVSLITYHENMYHLTYLNK